MKKLAPVATFRTGFAASRFAVCLSGSMDALDPNEPYTRIYILNERHANLWTFNEHAFAIPSICLWHDPVPGSLRYFAALSEQGEVVILAPELVRERIEDAGVGHPLAKGYGYLTHLQQIGDHLYACGHGGQVYRRDGPDRWAHMDDGILEAPGQGSWLPLVIGGPHERAIYLAGCELESGHPPRVDFWDGARWGRLKLPEGVGRITNLVVESEERVSLCGDHGTLLFGNAREGFARLGPARGTQLFTSVTKFQGRYYLGSNEGLFQLDPAARKLAFEKVRTGLVPELQDANVAQAAGDVLWSLGPKDIARFDGQRWERFHHPDNPRIGADTSTQRI